MASPDGDYFPLPGFICDTGLDGSSSVTLGTNVTGEQVVAPKRPIYAKGGFLQLGLPLSRRFNARPLGRNAGWSVYALYGIDQAGQYPRSESSRWKVAPI